MRFIALPDFVGEFDYGMVVMVSELEEELEPLFRYSRQGREIKYWFNWELVQVENHQYLVALDVEWEAGRSVAIGFTPDTWGYFPVVRKKENITLMTDWSPTPEDVFSKGREDELLVPRGLVIRNAYRGMDVLVRQVAQAASPLQNHKGQEQLERLQQILVGCVDPGLLH